MLTCSLLHAKTPPNMVLTSPRLLPPLQVFLDKEETTTKGLYILIKISSPCLICNTQLCPVHSVLCLGAVSFTLTSWVCIMFKEAVLVWDVFIINQMYYSNQITFQPKNTHFSFENNKGPWRFLGYSGHYSLNSTVNTHFLTTIIMIYL